MSYLMPKLETPIKVRVRGKDNGGWKGDPQWIGFITFTGKLTETGMPSILKLNIPGLPGQMFLSSIRRPSTEDEPDDMWIGVDGWLEDGHVLGSPTALKFEFGVHREWAHCFEAGLVDETEHMLGSGTSVGEIVDYATKKAAAVDSAAWAPEAKKAATVEWTPDAKERELIDFWTRVLNTSKESTDPVTIRALAVAIIREAIRRQSFKTEDGFMAPVRLPGQVNLPLLRSKVLEILNTTGLRRFACLGSRTLSFGHPLPDHLYDWGRMVEQVALAPLESLKLDVLPQDDGALPQTGHPGVDGGLAAALDLCKSTDSQFGSPKKG